MQRLVFIGAGRMASAMVRGLLAREVYPAREITCTSGPDDTAETLARETGISWFARPEDFPRQSADTVVLACKPQQLSELSAAYAENFAGKLVVSILAGTTLTRLDERFGQARNLVRVMPNTPAQIGAGISAFAARDGLREADRTTVEAILGALGSVVAVEEKDLDAVTGLSGSGPAYVFELVAALREGGVAEGLDRAVAAQLALETVLGAARLLKATGEEPETLRDRVTSPGGTTLAGLQAMEKGGFRELMKQTVAAATARSKELAKG